MAIKQMHHVGIIVDDLEGAALFFRTIGFDTPAPTIAEGHWVGDVNGIPDSRVELIMASTPDQRYRLELTRFLEPANEPGSGAAPSNRQGLRHIAIVVDDVDEVVSDLRELGYDTVADVVDYEDVYRLCYVRGPEGIIVELAHEVDDAS